MRRGWIIKEIEYTKHDTEKGTICCNAPFGENVLASAQGKKKSWASQACFGTTGWFGRGGPWQKGGKISLSRGVEFGVILWRSRSVNPVRYVAKGCSGVECCKVLVSKIGGKNMPGRKLA